MIAAAYAYFNYKFSEYRFVDFRNEIVLYTSKNIFVPSEDEYMVVVYSSNMPNSQKFLNELTSEYKILAIDLYQKRAESDDKIIYLTAGMDTLLQFVQKFNVYGVPTVFLLKKINNVLYKQDSDIRLVK